MFPFLNSGELVGPDFCSATEDGDVEVFTIVVARSVVVAVGPVASDVNLEVATEFTVFFHQQLLVEVGFHAEAQVDVDDAVVLLFSELAFFS